MKSDPLSSTRHDTSIIEALGSNQRDRLAFVDFRLFFLGTVSQIHICERFEIAHAATTRDFSLYRKLVPKNLMLDGTTKQYWPTENFSPLFDHPLDRFLQHYLLVMSRELMSVVKRHCSHAMLPRQSIARAYLYRHPLPVQSASDRQLR